MKLLDQYGQPLDTGVLRETQTARIATLNDMWLMPMLDGLTPARLHAALRQADHGDLLSQHRLFGDMEERDPHLLAEMSKRKLALLKLDWDIVPPRNASAAEKATAAWVKEVLTAAADSLEDLILACMDAVGHGFAPIELEWRQEGREWLPAFHPRPQEWFRLSRDRRALHLADASADGAPLVPFGWICHTHGQAKTGYLGRMGLYRALVWPFLYKNYALGDFAEFLETYGLPLIVGKYARDASEEQKASLLRAVTALGHDARAIMPVDMTIEIQKIASGGGGGAVSHLDMLDWADKAQSKCILGATLTSQADGKSSTNALGKVHEEVRIDIRDADARQVGGTLTRDLVYPLAALNRGGAGGIDSLRRCPRFVFDTSEADDLKGYAEALPQLVAAGMRRIPQHWVHERLRIPMATEGEEVLTVATASVPPAPSLAGSKTSAARAVLAANPARRSDDADPIGEDTDALTRATAASTDDWLALIEAELNRATDLPSLQQRLIALYGGLPSDTLTQLMSAAYALAELKGMADAHTL